MHHLLRGRDRSRPHQVRLPLWNGGVGPAQAELVGAIPALLSVGGGTHLPVHAPRLFHGCLHNEPTHREDRRRCAVLGAAETPRTGTTSAAAVPAGSSRTCPL